MTLCPPVFDTDIAVLDIADLAEAPMECGNKVEKY
jgi:hypothetical protein